MGDRKKNNRLVGILVGPALGFFALTALWHNEGRFDYYKAARATTPIGDDGSYEEGVFRFRGTRPDYLGSDYLGSVYLGSGVLGLAKSRF